MISTSDHRPRVPKRLPVIDPSLSFFDIRTGLLAVQLHTLCPSRFGTGTVLALVALPDRGKTSVGWCDLMLCGTAAAILDCRGLTLARLEHGFVCESSRITPQSLSGEEISQSPAWVESQRKDNLVFPL